ncbi:MAG: hypothetical protein C0506_13480 [Anaerolinea sp.]|nr:hypothetical protein [Anaerolinea sp.]
MNSTPRMLAIPGGTFRMGKDDSRADGARDDGSERWAVQRLSEACRTGEDGAPPEASGFRTEPVDEGTLASATDDRDDRAGVGIERERVP